MPVLDDSGRASFFLVPEARLTHLESVAGEESDATLARLRKLIAEADASPDIEAEAVYAELLTRARKIDVRPA